MPPFPSGRCIRTESTQRPNLKPTASSLADRACIGAVDRANLVVRPLSPRLYRKLATVIRRDKVLHLGLRETIRSLKGLAKAP